MTVAAYIGAPLESGDRLTREEFHRRYEARPDIKRAELVNGVVYLPSPTRFTFHDEPAALVIAWLVAYAAKHPEVRTGGSATLYLDGSSEVQPDAFAFSEVLPGAPRVNEDDYLEGAPHLVVEVAASSVSYDLHDKKEVYRRNGVLEYIVWRVLDGLIDWFRLVDGEYRLVHPNEDGIIESTVFPGLRLSVPRMLARDRAGILALLDWT
jgi:Uma2 family endonuclease